MAMRSIVALGAGLALAAAQTTTTESATTKVCNFESGCMDQTCDYWDYAYSCDTLEDYGCDCSGCACSDENSDDWLETGPDELTGIFGYIGGGFQNSVTGTFAVATAGYSNHAFDNYAAVSGGFKHDAFARFSSVVGGARNTARGRFSTGAGYSADAMKDFTASFSFNGETCATRSANSISFCAKSFKFNDYELLDLFDRRLAEEATPEDLEAVIIAQRKVIAEQNERLEVIEALLEKKGLSIE